MDFAGETSRILSALRAATPRVHCITNDAAQAFTADVLLAAGAVPSLTLAEEELSGFLAGAAALLVNLGTLDERRRKAIEVAVPLVVRSKAPWVLDPVFVERSDPRRALAERLLDAGPTAVRGNRAECEALKVGEGAGPVVAMTGITDRVSGGGRVAEIGNGHAHMGRATAMGCGLSAIVAACLAVEQDAWLACVAALTLWGVAGEVAGEAAGGPGTFRPLLLDALYGLDEETLRTRAKVRECKS